MGERHSQTPSVLRLLGMLAALVLLLGGVVAAVVLSVGPSVHRSLEQDDRGWERLQAAQR